MSLFRKQRREKLNSDSKATELLALLEGITFEEPQKAPKGRRAFNEANF